MVDVLGFRTPKFPHRVIYRKNRQNEEIPIILPDDANN